MCGSVGQCWPYCVLAYGEEQADILSAVAGGMSQTILQTTMPSVAGRPACAPVFEGLTYRRGFPQQVELEKGPSTMGCIPVSWVPVDSQAPAQLLPSSTPSHLYVTGCGFSGSPGGRSSCYRWGSGAASHWCVCGYG